MTYEHEKQALDEVRETQVDIAQKNKSAKKTLLMSIIMGIIGPTTVGLGLLVGQSSTQFADFVRRSIEFLAIVISYVVYSITTKENNTDEIKKQKYEKATDIFVSIAMILSGIIMTVLALYSGNEENGNMGLVKNSSTLTGGAFYNDLSGSVNEEIWLCPVTLFVLGKYPKNIQILEVCDCMPSKEQLEQILYNAIEYCLKDTRKQSQSIISLM